MADMTTYLKNALYDHVLRNTGYTSPTTVYVGLFYDDPTDAGTQTAEVDDHPDYTSGYSRQAVAWDAPSDGAGDNSAEELFGPILTTDDITITHVGILDASTAGNMLFHTALSSSKVVASGDILKYATGNLTVDID